MDRNGISGNVNVSVSEYSAEPPDNGEMYVFGEALYDDTFGYTAPYRPELCIKKWGA